MSTKRRRLHARYRGTVLTQGVLFGSAVGLATMAMAIDTGLMYSAKQELQNAADSAALAAASQLGATNEAQQLAGAEAAVFSSLNKVAKDGYDLNVDSDVQFGHAVLNGTKYDFYPDQQPFDAVRVHLHRDQTAADGPVSLTFARAIGRPTARVQASATAMLVPRDIAVVIDLSGSMNDDSELQHYKDFASGNGGTRPGVQVNTRDIWCALNGPAPSRPYIGGAPTTTEYAGDTGPTWGNLNAWGTQLTLGSYSPTTDTGLLYLKKTVNCTASSVTTNLTTRGYKTAASSSPSTMTEVDCLMKGTKDNNYSNNFKNRTLVVLGLADWRSGKSQSKYGQNVGGDGDDYVEDNELTAQVAYPSGMSGGSWSSYLTYVANSSTEMTGTDANFRYRHGLKTFVNYLLEDRAGNSQTPQLVSCPEMPVTAVKDAVQTMIDTIVELETQDHCSLEIFGTTSKHEVNLTIPAGGETLAEALQVVPDTLYQRQAAHYNGTTNIGAGINQGITELTSVRARSAAAKVLIMLTDGKPNIDSSGNYVYDNAPSVISWCTNRADAAKTQGITVYTVGVGADVNPTLLESLATRPEYYFYADSAPGPSGEPMYVEELKEIFQTLGGRRPVRLIQ